MSTRRAPLGWLLAVGGVWVVAASAACHGLTPVVLNPPPDGDAVRAIWMYPGTLFNTSTGAQTVLDFCAREGVNRVYFGGYSIWTNGTATQKSNLRAFITAAHASGIRVEAEMGDTHWQANPALVVLRIDQMIALHTATPGTTTDDFDAVHFDVEFWVDESWSSAATEADRRQIAIDYIDNVLVNARSRLNYWNENDMEVAVDLSAHLEKPDKLPTPFLYGGDTQSFLGHVFDHAADVVIMSYIDSSGGLLGWTDFELDVAVSKNRTIQLGADIESVPPTLPINSFADNAPTGYAAMTKELEAFHGLMTASRAEALDGFAIFQYVGYANEAPNPHNIADFDGDEDADGVDHAQFVTALVGPGMPVAGLARDYDIDGDGVVDLRDFAVFARCYTGSGVTGPFADECAR